MTGALARAFRQYKGAPGHHNHKSYQSIVFKISWAGNDLQGKDFADTSAAAQLVFDSTQMLTHGTIEIPQQNGHGLVVRVRYQYPFPWHIKGGKANVEFAPKLAMNDIARCLELAAPNRDTDLLLTANPDPSPWWQLLLRRSALNGEKRKIKRSKRAASKRAQDFP